MDLRNPLLNGVGWLERMALPHLIISGIILVIHPTLYFASQTLHQAMQVHGDWRPYIGAWNVPFNAVNVITNHGAPAHYDTSSSPYVPDLLISLGGDRSTNIQLQGPNCDIWEAPSVPFPDPISNMQWQYASGKTVFT